MCDMMTGALIFEYVSLNSSVCARRSSFRSSVPRPSVEMAPVTPPNTPPSPKPDIPARNSTTWWNSPACAANAVAPNIAEITTAASCFLDITPSSVLGWILLGLPRSMGTRFQWPTRRGCADPAGILTSWSDSWGASLTVEDGNNVFPCSYVRHLPVPQERPRRRRSRCRPRCDWHTGLGEAGRRRSTELVYASA